ncbi:MAG TPA: Asp-tRNA(Asn)/Glu-tRNA(Gln) amidotransferase subunit GatC [Candidatus Paceibacterota bacterium]|nr:Asp-tRNA(Asn)/Glu-tRNA(Gln) amidotransferase subunit GatC [Candidatus Paceibacterota bacterium]
MLTDKDVNHIASLARIDIDAKTRERMIKDLSSVLDYVEILQSVPTEGVEPLYQVTGLTGRTRADEHRNIFPMGAELQERLVGQAPDSADGYVKVNSVLRRES